jgi:hypothetical protein
METFFFSKEPSLAFPCPLIRTNDNKIVHLYGLTDISYKSILKTDEVLGEILEKRDAIESKKKE